jgi:hypothetical protein
MPPFQYRTFQDPYVGSITSLMGAGPEAEARSIRDVGDIRAEEAIQKGGIRSNLVRGLGETISQGYAGYRNAKADDMWAGFLGELHPDVNLDFDRMEMAESPVPWGITPGPDLEPAPPLTPQITSSETYRTDDPTITIDEAPTAEGPITTQTLPYEGAPQPTVVPEPSGVLGDIPGVAPRPDERSQPYGGQFFRNVTRHGLHDLEALRAQAARAGMGADQIARKIAESTAHNQGVTAFNQENSRLEMSDLEIRHEALLGTILGQNPRPTVELRSTLTSAFGATKGLEIFGTYTSSFEALQDIQQNNFENAGQKLRAILAGVRLTGNPRVQGELLDGIMSTFEEAGVPIARELQGRTVQEWEAIINRAFPEEMPTTRWAYERQLQTNIEAGVPGAEAARENYLQWERDTAPANYPRALTARLKYEDDLMDLDNIYRAFQADPITPIKFSDGADVTEEGYLRRRDALWDTLQTSLQVIEAAPRGIGELSPPRPGERIDAERDAQRTALTAEIAQLRQQITQISTPQDRGWEEVIREAFANLGSPGLGLRELLRGWIGGNSTREQLVADLETATAKLEALGASGVSPMPQGDVGNPALQNPEELNLSEWR